MVPGHKLESFGLTSYFHLLNFDLQVDFQKLL